MVKTSTDQKIAAKFAAVCSLHDFGVRMMKQNLTRKHPDKSPEAIRAMLLEWLGHGPQQTGSARRARTERDREVA